MNWGDHFVRVAGGSGGISTKTPKPQNPKTPSPHHPITPSPHHPITPSPYHPITLSPADRLLPHLNRQFKYLTAYNCIKMCNNSLANS
ncbi:hypothetical protein [Microcystis aeruginosa]|uniref:hypothetical protein n=1 Tax=Microcystis aeruginosa TaxID=1126 RepID=UPI0002F457B6|nr:hypothetical protein [Microcystis aeruginosa]